MISRFCGSGIHRFAMGNHLTAQFTTAKARCHDPVNVHGWYLGDTTSIRYFDSAKDEVTLVAGGGSLGILNGIGAAAGFLSIYSLLITSDGKTLWCAESSGLRRIDTASCEVCTLFSEAVSTLEWDRALPPTKRDAAFYCLTFACGQYGVINRFDVDKATAIDAGARTGVAPRDGGDENGRGSALDALTAITGVSSNALTLAVTETGHVFYIDADRHGDNPSVSVEKPYCERAASGSDDSDVAIPDKEEESDWLSSIEVHDFSPLAVIDSARLLVALNPSQQLTTYSLPPQYFALPKCCDRDL